MRIQADLHVHTVASGHAFSTVGEIAAEAARIGLRAVGVSDHGPAMPGGPHPYHFNCLRFLPRVMHGVHVLRGVEANVTSNRGTLDLPEEVLRRLDYVMVGFHDGCGFSPASAKKNTRVLLAAMEQPGVRVITHPGNPAFPIDIAAVAEAARDLGVALEINNASLTNARQGSREICTAIAAAVARAGGLVCLSSDAHVACDVGDVAEAWKVAAAGGIEAEQVVNRSFSGLMRFLGLDPLS